MTEESMQSTQTETKNFVLGQRLKSAREAMGMERKDVATQLRLHENVISMLEKDEYPNSLPTVFIRGYLRAYGKFLDLPDYVMKEAMAPIQPPPVKETTTPEAKKAAPARISKKMLMKTINAAIAITMVSLVWQWWNTHSAANVMPPEKDLAIPFDNGAPEAAQLSAATPMESAPIHTGNPTSIQSIQIPLAPQINRALSDATTKPVSPLKPDNTASATPAASQPVATAPERTSTVVAHSTKVKTLPAGDDDDDFDDVE